MLSSCKFSQSLSTRLAAVVIVIVIGLLGIARADTETCTNLADTLYCGCNSAETRKSRCLPHAERPMVSLRRSQILSTFPIVQKRLSFEVSYAGSGFHTYGSADFRVYVYARVGDYAAQGVGGKASSSALPWDAEGICTTLSGSACYSVVVQEGSVIKFWARAWQRSYQGYDLCGCNSDTVYLNSDGVPMPYDSTLARPRPEELGPPPCQAQMGDPINLMHGNLYNERSDVTLLSDLGPSLSVSRYYNSFAEVSGLLGNRWRLSFEYRLSRDSASGDYTLIEATGRQLTFTRHDLVCGATRITTYDPAYGVPYKISVDTAADIYTITRPDDVKLVFLGTGLLDSLQDLAGNGVRVFCTGTMIDSVRNASGRRLVFGHSGNQITSVLSSEGDTLAKYEYGSSSDPLGRVRLADGSGEEYSYGTESFDYQRMVSAISSDSVSRNYSYDSSGRAQSYCLGNGYERVGQTYPFVPELTDCTLPDKDTTVHNIYSKNGTAAYTVAWSPDRSVRQVIRRVNADCGDCAVAYTYDDNGMMRSRKYANGVADSMYYDSRGNVISRVVGANTSLKQQWNGTYAPTFNRPTLEQVASVAKSSDVAQQGYAYDTKGNLTRLVETGWKDGTNKYYDTSWFTYNSGNQLVKLDGPRRDVADTIKYAYYSNGDLQYEILANGDTTEFGHRDDLGHRTWVRSPNGDTTRYQSDQRGRLTDIISLAGTADSTAISCRYNYNGDLVAMTSPDGDSLVLHYNNEGYLDSVLNPQGSFARFTYDSTGNRLSDCLFTGGGVLRGQQSYSYDDKHQLTRVAGLHGDTTWLGYSPVATVDTLWDALNHRTVARRDSLRRVVETVQPNSGDSIKTQYTYDKHNNITKVTDPSGYQYVFKYDDKDRLTYDSCAVTGVTKYGYDAANNLVWKKNAAADSVAFKYDVLNRLTAMLFPDSQNIRFKYDGTEFPCGRGRLYMDSTASAWTKYQYDARGRIYREIRRFASDTLSYVTTYHYDKDDNIDTLTYPTGTVAAYAYDADDNVTRVRLYSAGQWTTIVDSVRYAPFGEAESWVLGNGIHLSVGIDSSYRKDSISTAPDTVSRIKYELNAAGDITGITNWLDSSANRAFTYDDIYRLTQASSRDYPDTLQRYVYARNGNRDTVLNYGTSGIDTAVYTYSNNRLTQVGGVNGMSLSYDMLGNVTQQIRGADTTTFQYNKAGMMTGVNNGTTATYSYDALYRRVKKVTAGNTTTKFIPNEYGQLLTEYGVTGGWQRDYVYLNGQLIGRVSSVAGERIQYVITDHLGTPTALVDSAKTIRWKAKYYPFGQTYSEYVSATNDVRFPGQLRDDETGLYYNWHRYYGASLGRYYQADPIGLAGGTSLYGYALANPVRFTDPDGNVVVVIAVAYGLYEVGSSIWDIWTTAKTLFDDCASTKEKLATAGMALAGVFLPGGGYAGGGKAALRQLERHHMIPRQFVEKALEVGIDIEDWVKIVPVGEHRFLPGGIHTGPDNYNKAWKSFFQDNPNPSSHQILNHMYRLNRNYGLTGYRWAK